MEQEETLQKAIYREVYEEVGITLMQEHSFFWKSLFVRVQILIKKNFVLI